MHYCWSAWLTDPSLSTTTPTGEVEIYKTETLKRTLNPKWKCFHVPQIMCENKTHCTLLFMH